jgi:hypothetical protein
MECHFYCTYHKFENYKIECLQQEQVLSFYNNVKSWYNVTNVIILYTSGLRHNPISAYPDKKTFQSLFVSEESSCLLHRFFGQEPSVNYIVSSSELESLDHQNEFGEEMKFYHIDDLPIGNQGMDCEATSHSLCQKPFCPLLRNSFV